MKVFLIGANGQIGQRLVSLFQDNPDHSIRAMVRKEEQKASLEAAGAEAVLANLEGSPEEIAAAAKGCDAIIFTAGSGGSTGYDKTLLVDLDGAAKAIEAAVPLPESNGLLWSAPCKPITVKIGMRHSSLIMWYKHYADKILEASGLTYTIIRPGGLRNEPGTGTVSAAKDLERGFISRDDVAKTVIASLDEKNTENRPLI
nr:SDR family oxidoreductase [Bacillus subtilis]